MATEALPVDESFAVLADALDPALQLGEPHELLLAELVNDRERPLVTDPVQDLSRVTQSCVVFVR